MYEQLYKILSAISTLINLFIRGFGDKMMGKSVFAFNPI